MNRIKTVKMFDVSYKGDIYLYQATQISIHFKYQTFFSRVHVQIIN